MVFGMKWLSVQFFYCEHNIILIKIRILGKSGKMDSKEDNVVTIFLNSCNAIHGSTDLLKWRYINNADLLQ